MAGPPNEREAPPPLLRRAIPVLAILLGLSVSLDLDSLDPLRQGVDVSRDIVHRSAQYRQQVAANDALAGEVAYLQTPAGGRWAVYRYRGLVPPGQQVGRIVEAPPPAPEPLTQPERFRRWITGVEERSAAVVREWVQIARCYAGCRPLDQPPKAETAAAHGCPITTGHVDEDG